MSKKKRNTYIRTERYAKMLMEHNARNPNISQAQAEFLQQLAHYRHCLHSNPHQYFFNQKKSVEIDTFFALAHSQLYFQMLDLPYPKEMFDGLLKLKVDRDLQYTDFSKAVEHFAQDSETLNTLIERYLKSIDDEKGTKYCPTGKLRDPTRNHIQRTIDVLYKAQKQISPFQEKIYRELDKLNEPSKIKMNNDMEL